MMSVNSLQFHKAYFFQAINEQDEVRAPHLYCETTVSS